jgi:hypothetical protein
VPLQQTFSKKAQQTPLQQLPPQSPQSIVWPQPSDCGPQAPFTQGFTASQQVLVMGLHTFSKEAQQTPLQQG